MSGFLIFDHVKHFDEKIVKTSLRGDTEMRWMWELTSNLKNMLSVFNT